MSGHGYRQKGILRLLEQRPRVPVGYLCRQLDADGKIVDASLRALARQGLVRRVSYGVWERV